MTIDFNSDEVRQIIREELHRQELERQKRCRHFVSGTIQPDGTVTCDSCGKVVTEAVDGQEGHDEHRGPIDDKVLGSVREREGPEFGAPFGRVSKLRKEDA